MATDRSKRNRPDRSRRAINYNAIEKNLWVGAAKVVNFVDTVQTKAYNVHTQMAFAGQKTNNKAAPDFLKLFQLGTYRHKPAVKWIFGGALAVMSFGSYRLFAADDAKSPKNAQMASALSSVLKVNYNETTVYGQNKTFDQIADTSTSVDGLLSAVETAYGAPLNKSEWIAEEKNQINLDSLNTAVYYDVRDSLLETQAVTIPSVMPLAGGMKPGKDFYTGKKGSKKEGSGRPHPARDYTAKVGGLQVQAAMDGTLTRKGVDGKRNYYMTFKGGKVTPTKSIYHEYVHTRPSNLPIGTAVEKGDQIATLAQRGQFGYGSSRGTHLHFAIYLVDDSKKNTRKNREYLDPEDLHDAGWNKIVLEQKSAPVKSFDPAMQDVIVENTVSTYTAVDFKTAVENRIEERVEEYGYKNPRVKQTKLDKFIESRKQKAQSTVNDIDQSVAAGVQQRLSQEYDHLASQTQNELALLDAEQKLQNVAQVKEKPPVTAAAFMPVFSSSRSISGMWNSTVSGNVSITYTAAKGENINLTPKLLRQSIGESPLSANIARLMDGTKAEAVATFTNNVTQNENAALDMNAVNPHSKAAGVFQEVPKTQSYIYKQTGIRFKTGNTKDVLDNQVYHGLYQKQLAAIVTNNKDEQFRREFGENLYGPGKMWYVNGTLKEVRKVHVVSMSSYGETRVNDSLYASAKRAKEKGEAYPILNGVFYTNGGTVRQDMTTHYGDVPENAGQMSREEKIRKAAANGVNVTMPKDTLATKIPAVDTARKIHVEMPQPR